MYKKIGENHCKDINKSRHNAGKYLPEVKLTQLKALPGCSDDNATVASLPNDWVPKHSGPILTNYLREREQKHNAILEELHDKATAVNQAINKKVQELAETLVEHLKDFESCVGQVFNENNVYEEPLTSEIRSFVLKEINNLSDIRIEAIKMFRQSALQLEYERVEQLKIIMRDQFQRLIEIGHYPPTVLTQDFNNRMYEFNQQMYNNLRAYEELESELKAEVEENKRKGKSALNQMCIGIGTVYRSSSARDTRFHSLFKKPLVKRSLSVGERKRSYGIIKKLFVGTAKDEIEKCVTQLVEAYRQSVLNVFTGFKGQLKDLRKDLTYGEFTTNNTFRHVSITCLNNLSAMIAKASWCISQTVQDQLSVSNFANLLQITQVDVSNIQTSLTSLGECLCDTFSILHNAGHLWDAHVMRSAFAQKLTITAVEDMLTNHDMVQQANEVPLNLALEQLLSAPNEEKLEFQYASLLKMLDTMKLMYKQHSEAEIGRLEQFLTLPPWLTNVLLAEFGCFLETNRKNPNTTMSSCGIPGLNTLNNPKPIPRAIIQTELQQLSLNNWRNGFLEALDSSVQQIPEELMNQSQVWVNDRAAALVNRFLVKQVSHDIRRERIKAVYEKRLAALRYHSARLKSHMEAIHELVKSLNAENSKALNLDAPDLYPLRQWLNGINEDMQALLTTPNLGPEVRLLKMTSYAQRLTRHRNLFEQSLGQVLTEYKQEVEHKLQNARISNVRFLSTVKLGYQHGNYSVQEAETVWKALIKAAELVETCQDNLQNVLNDQHAQFLALADLELQPLEKVIEPFVKVSGKDTKKGKRPSKVK